MARHEGVRRTTGEPDRQRLLEWVEEVAAFFARSNGWPPITGRILGWLMVCDPPEQSAGEIAAAIGASRASLTTTMRLLTTVGLVRRGSRPGGRTSYYCVEDDAWEKVIQQRLVATREFCAIAQEGLRLVGPETARAARLRDAYEMFDWFGHMLAQARRPSQRGGPAKG